MLVNTGQSTSCCSSVVWQPCCRSPSRPVQLSVQTALQLPVARCYCRCRPPRCHREPIPDETLWRKWTMWRGTSSS